MAGSADRLVISGGNGRNVAPVKKIKTRLDGPEVNLPPEPMIVGAVAPALFTLDRAGKEALMDTAETAAG